MSGRGHVELRLSQEELRLVALACGREIDYFHHGDMRKRGILTGAYQRMLRALRPLPLNLRSEVEEGA